VKTDCFRKYTNGLQEIGMVFPDNARHTKPGSAFFADVRIKKIHV